MIYFYMCIVAINAYDNMSRVIMEMVRFCIAQTRFFFFFFFFFFFENIHLIVKNINSFKLYTTYCLNVYITNAYAVQNHFLYIESCTHFYFMQIRLAFYSSVKN